MAMPLIGWIEVYANHDCRLRAEWKGRLIYNRSESSNYDLSQMTAEIEGNPPESGSLTLFEPLNGELNDVLTERYDKSHYLNRRTQR
jgi:hypothetical protein